MTTRAFPTASCGARPRPPTRSRAAPRILVTENGIATSDDADRIDFTANALRGLHAAIGAGAGVRGYFHWSLLDKPLAGVDAVPGAAALDSR